MQPNSANHESSEMEQVSVQSDMLISDLINGFRRFWWIYLVITALCALITLIPHGGYVPQYQADATFTVSILTETAGTSDVGGKDSFYDNDAAEQLSTLFPYIVQCNKIKTYL